MRDVVVIGAGPAGSVAAARLAAAGHDVVVLEEHDTIGQPVHCTGLLGEDAFEEFALPRTLALARAEGARFWGVAGQSVRMQSESIRAVIIDRGALDELLAARALAHGAEIRRQARAESIEITPASVRLTIREQAQPIVARTCVLACGANYRFHRKLGLGLPAAFLQSAQVEASFAARPDIEVRFGRALAPGGFAWLVPFQQGETHRARIGLISETRARERFASFVADLGAGTPPLAPRLKMLPLAPTTRTFADRVVAVGDAAGLVKPITGGGIYYGMLSGAMAADSIHTGLRTDRLGAGSLAGYEKAWRRRLGAEIRTGLRFRQIMSRLNDDAIDALIDLANINGVVPLLQKKASFNWHRQAAVALLGHPAFRQIALKSWTRTANPF